VGEVGVGEGDVGESGDGGALAGVLQGLVVEIEADDLAAGAD